MPYEFEVDPQARLAFVRGWGPMVLEETLRVPELLAARPDFEADFGVLADLRGLEYQPRAQDVLTVGRNLVRLHGAFRHRVAVVVPPELSLAAELGAAIASAGGFPLRIFECADEARDWVTRPAGSDADPG